jgi:hypothetical protein
MGGGSKPSTTTQINKVELPAWVDAASQENYAAAKDIAGTPYEAYGGQQVAAMDPNTRKAIDMTMNTIGATSPQFGAAADSLQGLLGKNIDQVQAGTITPQTVKGADLNPYLNPYITNVENRTADAMNRSATLRQNAAASQANQAKAFGGTRFGVQQGVAEGENTRAVGDMSAALRKSGYDAATGLLTGDITRDMSAQESNVGNALKAAQGNQAASLDEIRAKTGAGTALTSNAAQQAATNLADVGAAYQAGDVAQQQNQRELSQAEQNWQREQAYPTEMLNLKLAALGMSPYGRTETSTKTGTSEKSGTDWATAALGGAKTVASLLPLMGFSEDSAKTDVEPVGNMMTPSGKQLKVKAFRYKSDPKTYPKTVGVMASDIQKSVPDAVRKVGKNRVIDYTKLQRGMNV